MSKPIPQDPEKRAAKAARKKRRKAAEAAGAHMPPRQARPRAQMDHGTNPRGRRKARDGEAALEREFMNRGEPNGWDQVHDHDNLPWTVGMV